MKLNNRISATAAPRPVLIRRPPRKGRSRLSACRALLTALLTAALPAGCGSDAHANSATALRSSALHYSNCMRAHGVPDFPDPNSRGAIQIRTAAQVNDGRTTAIGDLDPGSPAFQAAERACGPLPSGVTAAQERQQFSKELKAAACIRANGVPDYPDPKLIDGSITISFPNINRSSAAAFQHAVTKCARGLPLGPPPSSSAGR